MENIWNMFEFWLQDVESKLKKKLVDFVIANPVGRETGPEADLNEIWILKPNTPALHIEPASKAQIARSLVKELFLVWLPIREWNGMKLLAG